MESNWIAIDWGTTNFRAFLMKDAEVVEEFSNGQGILSLQSHQFESVLQQNIEKWLGLYPTIPIIMAGMVGSQQGWHEIPYQPLPVRGQALIDHAVSFKTSWGSPVWIIPGVNGNSEYGLPDVMRGEETQLIGLAALSESDNNYAIMPGTHCKHAVIENQQIESFTSFMTGELFSLLMSGSMIGKALPEQVDQEKYFLEGVTQACQDIPFTHLIFSARTKRLKGEIPNDAVSSYLSGLLIGYELKGINHHHKIWIVSSQSLGDRYVLAGQHLQLDLHHISGTECFLKGTFKLLSDAGAIKS